MNFLAARTIPLASILVVALLGVLPWGQGNALGFLFPAAVFMVIHFWHYRDDRIISPLAITVIGLAMDVLTSGPLGFWPFVLLIGMAMTRLMARVVGPAGGVVQWLSFAAACATLSLVAWMLASAYFVQTVNWHPMAIALAVQLLAYPLVTAVLAPLEAVIRRPRVMTFERGS